MLLTHDKFNFFATKPFADTKSSLAGLFSLSVGRVQEMNEMMAKSLQAGRVEPNEMRDYSFMQQRTI
jgi:uncharacterized protein